MFSTSPDSASLMNIYQHYSRLISMEMNDIETGLANLVLPIIPEPVVATLCRNASYYFQREPVLMRLNMDIVIVGDLHGHLLDLLRIIKKFGHPANTNYLFLGDIIDRGEFSVETISLIFVMKVLWPQHVYIIRGNHEFKEICTEGGFLAEIQSIYGNVNVAKHFFSAFEMIPLGALIYNKVLCLHGGIGPNVESISNIETIQRPLSGFSDEIATSVLWSDPSENIQFYSPSARGSGYYFGQKAFMKFLTQNNLDLVVRGHECAEAGITMHFAKRLLTVFSASNYCGITPNKSAVLSILGGGMRKEATVFLPLRFIKRQQAVFIKSQFENTFKLAPEVVEEKFSKISLPSLSNSRLESRSGIMPLPHRSNKAKKLLQDIKPERHMLKRRSSESMVFDKRAASSVISLAASKNFYSSAKSSEVWKDL